MHDSNMKTLASYEAGAKEYIENTPSNRQDTVHDWIDVSLKGLEANAKILELGSGFGRDAQYFEGKGFKIEKTDAARSFVKVLRETDPTARELNLLTDPLGSNYDLIFANAVLLHFTENEVDHSLRKIFDALAPGGTFAFSVKQGEGEAWKTDKGMGPRFFRYWHKEDITERLTKAGFTEINAWLDDTEAARATWILIVAQKPQ